jgi:hypothetical protein
MGLLQRLFKGGSEDKKEFKEKFKQAQQDDKVANMLEERKKSSNQRELERYMKEQEESQIKMELDKIHKQQNSENWKSKNSMLKGQTSILKTDRPILKEKNIFNGNPNMFTKEHAIKHNTDMGFFK